MSTIPLVETVVSVILTVLRDGGLPALVALMAVESFGIPPLPSEIILPFAGFLVAQQDYPFAAAVGAALLGGVIGAYAAYVVGRWGRHLLVGGPRFLRLEERHLAAMDRWFERRGEGTVLIARLVPVVRSYISYPAGASRMEPARFGIYTAIVAAPFTAAFIYAGVLLGNDWSQIIPYLQYADYAGVVLVVLALVYVFLRWRSDRRTAGAGAPTAAESTREAPPPA